MKPEQSPNPPPVEDPVDPCQETVQKNYSQHELGYEVGPENIYKKVVGDGIQTRVTMHFKKSGTFQIVTAQVGKGTILGDLRKVNGTFEEGDTRELEILDGPGAYHIHVAQDVGELKPLKAKLYTAETYCTMHNETEAPSFETEEGNSQVMATVEDETQ